MHEGAEAGAGRAAAAALELQQLGLGRRGRHAVGDLAARELGHGDHPDARDLRLRHDVVPAPPPGAVAVEVPVDDVLGNVLRQQLRLPDAEPGLDVEVQRVGVPPHHRVPGARRTAGGRQRGARSRRRCGPPGGDRPRTRRGRHARGGGAPGGGPPRPGGRPVRRGCRRRRRSARGRNAGAGSVGRAGGRGPAGNGKRHHGGPAPVLVEPVRARRDGVGARGVAVRPLEHAVAAEPRAGGGRAGVAALGRRGIDGGVERIEPSPLVRPVADGRHHQQVAGARGGDVGEPDALLAVPLHLLGLVVEEVEGRPAGEPQRAQPAGRIDEAARRLPVEAAGRIGEDHHRELEPLGPVHGHDAHAVAALLENRRLARLPGQGLALELLDEPAEREPAARLVAPGQLRHEEHVGEGLLAPRPHDEAGVGAGGLEQPADGLRHRHHVPPPVGVLQHRQRIGDRPQPLSQAGVAALSGPELRGNAEGVQPAEPLVVLEQGRVLDREERPLQGGEHGELVVRVLDGGEGGPHRRHLLPVVEAPAAHEEMRQVARLEGLDVGTGHVLAEALEAPEQDAHVPRRHRDPRRPGAVARRVLPRRPPLRHPPAALGDEPADERADRVGQRALDGGGGDPPPAVGAGDGQHDDAGLPLRVVPMRRQRHVVGLMRAVAVGPAGRAGRRAADRGIGAPARAAAGGGPAGARHHRREGPVHEALDAGHRAEAGGEGEGGHPGRFQLALDLPVDADVGPPEPVDRLLGVADDEQLPRRRPDPAPVPFRRIAGGEQQEDLRLQRIGVLELVDEDAGEPALEVGADRVAVAHEVARLDEEVDEVEAAGVALQLAEAGYRRLQLVPQEGGEVRVGDPPEVLQHVHHPAVPVEHRLPRDVVSVLCSRPSPAREPVSIHQLALVDGPAVPGPRSLPGVGELAVAGQLDERRLDDVVVAGGPQLVLLPYLARQQHRRPDVQIQPVARVVRPFGQRREIDEVADDPIDDGGPIEALAAPRGLEVAPLGEARRRGEQPLGGALLRPRLAEAARGTAAQRAPQPLRRVGQRRLEPGVEGLPEDRLGSASTSKRGSTFASTGRSRRRSAQKPWMVLTWASSRWAMACSTCFRDGGALAGAGVPRRKRRRAQAHDARVRAPPGGATSTRRPPSR